MDQDLQTIPKNLPRRYTGPKGIPIEKLIELRSKNLSYQEIGEKLNIHPKTAYIRLRPIIQELENNELYKKHRVEIFTLKERQVIQSITPRDLARANLQQKTWSAKAIHEMGRLESGKSTSNISYVDMIKAKEKIDKENEAIDAELKESGVEIPVYNSDPQVVDNQETNATP